MAQKAKMFYGKNIETALHALSLSRLRDSSLSEGAFCFFESCKKERRRMCILFPLQPRVVGTSTPTDLWYFYRFVDRRMRGDIPAKPSPVEKVDRPSLYAKVETDEVKINKI